MEEDPIYLARSIRSYVWQSDDGSQGRGKG